MNTINVQYNDTPQTIAVKSVYKDGSGYAIINGMTALANKIITNMTPAQKLRYDFYQSQLNRVRKEY